MPSDAWQQGPATPQPKSLESLRKTFRQKLNAILYKELTVENIESFADKALSETISLNEEILEEYKNNPILNKGATLNIQEQEDEAYKLLDLENIQLILQSISEKKDQIDTLKKYAHTNAENTDTLITPPQENEVTKREGENGTFVEKKIFPRLLTLLYILEHDFNIISTPENIAIKEGVVTQEMIRKTPYVRIEIPVQKRVVYICDEEGNISYVFDTTKITEHGLTLGEIDVEDKGDKNSLISKYPGIGIRIRQTNQWRNRMKEFLEKPIQEIQRYAEEIPKKREPVSEFKERKEWPSFEDFQTDVKKYYPGKKNVVKWYMVERTKHPNWHSDPQRKYKDKGWTGWPELVGKENDKKRTFLPFKDLQAEVRTLYPGEGDVQRWYLSEQKMHHSNWPSNPHQKYQGKGWIGWAELVGRENHLKKEFLAFEKFQAEVRNLYLGEGNIQKWYTKKRKNNSHWPSDPDAKYKDKGWVGWPELVGKENILKKEFLSFEQFQAEVRNLYPGEGDVQRWYATEQKKRQRNWPSNPDKFYKDRGWAGFLKLVGKESVEFPSFQDLQRQVRALYKGHGDVRNWYLSIFKNYSNWPHNPHETYKGKGWVSWPEFVGKK